MEPQHYARLGAAVTAPVVPFVDLIAQHRGLERELRAALDGMLARCDFILGAEVGRFEEAFAEYCEAGFCVGADSGLSALELALRAAGIGPGDEVIVPASTFIATFWAVSSVGARPVPADVERATLTLDPAAAARAITPRTRALLPVHLYGQPAAMSELAELAARQRLVLIEDAAQAHGARYDGRRVGSFGLAGCFSFYPAKNLGALGDAGAVVTNDPTLAETMRTLRNCGQREKYQHVAPPLNHRLDTLHAAALRVKLPHLDGWNAARQRQAALYTALLTGCPGLETPQVGAHRSHVYHLYVVRVERRDGLRAWLAERGIATGIHYPVPPHLQPVYADLGYGPGAFPVTEDAAGRVLSLPIYPELTEDQVRHVATSVRSFYER